MKRKMMKTTMILMALLFTGAMAFAQPPKGMTRGKGMPGMAPQKAMMQNMLNITDEQKEQMKQLRLDKTKETLPLRSEMAVLKAEYHKLMTAEKPVEKEINANIDKQTALMNKMKKVNAKFALKMRNILTEEQWLMIQSHRGMKAKGGKGFHRSGGHGAGPCGMTPGQGMRPRMNMRPAGMTPKIPDNK